MFKYSDYFRPKIVTVKMSEVFQYRRPIEPSQIDVQGIVNNVVYLQWMLDAAVAHCESVGWPWSRFKQLGCGWVVREHRLEYLVSARRGDEIVVRTWVDSMNKVSSSRQYRIHRVTDDVLLCQGETRWAFVNLTTGKPVRVPAEMIRSFPVLCLS